MSFLQHLSSSWSNFKKDENGVASIEFVLLAPVLCLGLVGFFLAMQMEKRSAATSKVSATVADIISQTEITSTSFIGEAIKAGRAIIGPDADTNLGVLVQGIKIFEVVDASGNGTDTYDSEVRWYHKVNGTGLPTPNKVPRAGLVPPELLTKEGFLIVAKARLTDQPDFLDRFTGETNAVYEYEHFFMSRESLETDCTDCTQP